MREFWSDVSPVAVEEGSEVTPQSFTLHQNYPNPFNPTTSIQYELPKATQVTISVFNILGQTVITLVDEKQNAGKYQVQWNGKNNQDGNVAAGIYLLNFSAGTISKTRKMLLIR